MSEHTKTAAASYFTPTIFPRHNRFLHAVIQANQAWFCVHDLGRLMGRPLDQRLTQNSIPISADMSGC